MRTGKPRREFLWSEDMADACVYIMEKVNFKDLTTKPTVENPVPEIRNTHINIGTGTDISILDLANLIKTAIGFQGELFFNEDKPDGTMKKLTDVSKLNETGWHFKVDIKEGINKMYNWYTTK